MEACQAIDARFVAEVEKQRCGAQAKRFKISIVRRYVGFMRSEYDLDAVQATQKEIYAWLQTRNYLKPRSYNHELAVLKAFWRYLEKEHGYSCDLTAIRNKSVQQLLPRNIPQERLHQLCTPGEDESLHTTTALRDQAIIEFLVSTGVCGIELRSVEFGHLSKDLSECLIVTAKGGVNRIVYLGKEGRVAIAAYLARRNLNRSQDARSWLFPSRTGKQMDESALIRVVKKLAFRRLGYVVTPHMCRHSFGTEMLRATGCLRSVQIMMGHSRLRNTAIYCALDFADHCHAMGRFHPHGAEFGTRTAVRMLLDNEEEE